MKTPTRRRRSDSISAATDVARAATSNIVPPAHVVMADEDWPFWRSIVAEFARSEWSDHQLEVAAFLARTMADFEREQRKLRTEGATVTGAQGAPAVNPRKAVVQMHAASILSLRRSLSIHGRAQGGEARDVGKRRAVAKKQEADTADASKSGLIARPAGTA